MVFLHHSMGSYPYSLIYGMEVVLQTNWASVMQSPVGQESNDDARVLELDLLEEKRLKAQQTMERAKLSATWYYKKKVKHRQFVVGEYVLRHHQFKE